MKAWQVHAWGEPNQMTLAEVPVPEPGPGQVRIRTRASALNFFDVLMIQGKYQVKPPFPFTPGAEIAGVVDSVGPGSIALTPGDRVMAMPQIGGYAEYCIADAKRVFKIRDDLDFGEAAAMPIVYHTSWFALTHRTKLQQGEWLLVHAGASGVGMSAIQIGRSLGARVIATAGSPDKLEFSKQQGAEHALDYKDPSWVDQVKQITGGRGADVIYDPVGGDICDLSTKCIAPEGRLLIIGFASGRISSIPANRVLLKNISVVGVLWGGYITTHPSYLAEAQEQLNRMLAAGQIKPVVSKRYRLEEAPSALEDLAARRVLGKAVLYIGAPSSSM